MSASLENSELFLIVAGCRARFIVSPAPATFKKTYGTALLGRWFFQIRLPIPVQQTIKTGIAHLIVNDPAIT